MVTEVDRAIPSGQQKTAQPVPLEGGRTNLYRVAVQLLT